MRRLDDVAVRLAAERELTVLRLAHLRGDFADLVAAAQASNADDEHDAEGATIAFERAQVAALIEQAERHLDQVDRALERVESDSFGRCERCDEPIPVERLAVRPTATTCVGCAS